MLDYSDCIERDDVGKVKKMLKRKLISPYYFTEEDCFITPIATAAHHGSIGCLLLLCSHGAVTNLRTTKKQTLSPLVAAIVSNQPRYIKIQMLKILQENGCRF
ncbi:ankyrin repeat domain-containing protein [Halodesulfovibrio spirochaetisodalis]|uniref:Ankyrin n=1 Tax=Halodesulfovibrio spirochaetisodalis TaxID=1560234 RepID=A0A1B7XI60_9BACT|nr:ankyrin repeat domain-containing protein [Halodesulfovibrio spirochaetisodalis]OBQ55194.1 hypothetical protein SP90_04295 [Halodesulfovibrio spirochaetisodalis]